MTLFTISDIERSFTPTILARGRDYVRRNMVTRSWVDGSGLIHGVVRGPESASFNVEIEVQDRGLRTSLKSTCTCPSGGKCLHASALALHALDYPLPVIKGDEVASPSVPANLEAKPATSVPVPHEVSEWLDRLVATRNELDEFDSEAKTRLFYLLGTKAMPSGVEVPTVVLVSRSILKKGEFGSPVEIKAANASAGSLPKYLNAYDRNLVTDIDRNAIKLDWNRAEYRLDGAHGARLVTAILNSGRSAWKSFTDKGFLALGDAKQGSLGWREIGATGMMQPTVDFGGEGDVLSVSPPFYVDTLHLRCGPILTDLPEQTAGAFLRVGPIRPEVLPTVRQKLAEFGMKEEALPNPRLTSVIRSPEPVPCLYIDFETCERITYSWGDPSITAPVAFANLTFEYEGHPAPPDGADLRFETDSEVVLIQRNPIQEAAALARLEQNGWVDPTYNGWHVPKGRNKSLCIVPPDEYRLEYPIERITQFQESLFPELRDLGWKVEVNSRYRIVDDDDIEWDLGLESGSGIDWFEVQVGIKVEGKPFDLKSVLRKLFNDQAAARSRQSRNRLLDGSDDLYVFDDEGRAIKLSRKRLNAILRPLVELFGGVQEWPTELRMPKSMLSEAAILEETLDDVYLPWRTSDELRGLSNRLEEFDHLAPLPEPEGFIGELRGYQREGLAWLDFLREYGFGGILADDMGLGKTVQLLAFLQAEKTAGRLTKPCLIVAPTSTLPNWRRECQRFTPGLKVLSLQGAGRHGRFAELAECDIALTTYPLLARDKEHLKGTSYHAIVLDEAQNVKNPITIAARAARELEANHRICMSGTPVENHLGELWSLFHFLMPGFLGPDAEFKRRFRGPIEKNGDTEARDRLARRIRPFMLRRTKDKVVKELPAKTEIVETVELEEAQRDFYESIRLAMDDQVRRLIATQGFDRSRMQILDALLKLRQACCDPRLVKLPSAESVNESAKLDRLIDMLTVLIEDGRKVLLFSQFTSMLNLIEERLKQNGISWVRISGDVVDRDTPVQRFQAGEVPLFLISLKAGGTGLNLTAADTVILYDPWWNPAVENQAIDRAHRIGQDKAVMVYRLVAAGTIEEKMLQMQARKGELAKSILTDDGDIVQSLTADDLQWILSKD